MERDDNIDPVTKARAKRSLVLKENRSKRTKHNPHQPISLETSHNSPTYLTPRQPLSDLTQSFRNQNFQSQPHNEAIFKSRVFAGSEPSPSRYGFKTNLRTAHLESLGTNLLSKFTADATLISSETFTQSTLEPTKDRRLVTNKPARGSPRNHLGVPNIAFNLSRNLPIETNHIGTANTKRAFKSKNETRTQGVTVQRGNYGINSVLSHIVGLDVKEQSTSAVTHPNETNYLLDAVTQLQCPTITKLGRAWPRKQLGVPNLAINLSIKFSIQTNKQQTATDNGTADSPSQNSHRSELSCPIFTPTVNLDFNSDYEDDSEYDPFATYLSKDDEWSESEDIAAPFTIHDNSGGTSEDYYDVGDPLIECRYCKEIMWYQERMHKSSHAANPKFMLCCGNGKEELPLLEQPPDILARLLFNNNILDSRKFQHQIRVYNMMFAFNSPRAKLDNRFNNGRGPPTIRIQGQTCHRIGSLLPPEGQKPKFAQLYIYDTENEVTNRMQGLRNSKIIDEMVVQQLSNMLYECNPHAKNFQMARKWLDNGENQNLKLRLISDRSTYGRVYNKPTVSEVAALVVGDIDTAEMRDIIMQTKGGQLQRINDLHASYMAFQYPLIFPYGEDGYRPDVAHGDLPSYENSIRNRLTIREWLAFRIQTSLCKAKTLLSSRRLFQQFLCDGYTMLESKKLERLRKNQPKLRVFKYKSLNEEGDHSQNIGSSIGKRVVLPSSFIGGRRFMNQLYYDGMAICSKVGFPDLFITFTCNPNWPEIQRVLGPLHLKPQDRPDIISRIFKIKFDKLLTDLTKKGVLGKVLAYMYTIEFQKRGLPHARVLIFLHPLNKYPRPEDINKIISAEVPDPLTQPRLYNLVKSHMVHGPCGLENVNSPCMKDRKCSKYFPKKFQPTIIVDQDGYPIYRRRNSGHTIDKNGVIFHSGHVVPHNPSSDRISAVIHGSDKNNIDEIKQYLDCRYISPSEPCWRIFPYSIHGQKPAVERLYFHMEGENSVYYKDYEQVGDVLLKPSVTESMFTSWSEANKTYEEARLLTFGDFVSKFVYHKRSRSWKPRKRGYTIGRLIWVPQSTGELFYLRMMLTVKKGPLCYDDIKMVDGKQHKTFRGSCFAMGFLQDDREFVEAIKEAHVWGSGLFLRKLFVTMLLSSSMNRPEHVWRLTWKYLSDGILYDQRLLAGDQGLTLTGGELKELTLMTIETLLQNNNKSLKDFKPMPYPKDFVVSFIGNRLLYDERQYNVVEHQQIFANLYSSLTDEQRTIYEEIMVVVQKQRAALRSQKKIVLPVASSGIASLLLPGGRTAHSRFKISVSTLETSICNINKKDDLAELLKMTDLIIWDEAPMATKFCFESLDKSLKDIMSGMPHASHKIFGGKVVVFGGDFRQIIPIIPRGTRSDIIHATINSSYIWDHCKVLKLTKNMRLQSGETTSTTNDIRRFSEWILNIRDGTVCEPNDGYADICIPDEFLISNFSDPIKAIVEDTYPDLIHNYLDPIKAHVWVENRTQLVAIVP
ncbi:uncharacterized protein LOC131622824 [Vicia villosa]|uniref:uncharacterized protein LOC131622824 n=1 Tax=Vicia villosa TaxID=3911 RepID=UPI00273A8E3E|nr:uncharacterized protein LOC131622824 [Vicia villosa]